MFEEDPKEFLDCVEKVTDIIGVTFSYSADLVTYQFQRVAHTWIKQ